MLMGDGRTHFAAAWTRTQESHLIEDEPTILQIIKKERKEVPFCSLLEWTMLDIGKNNDYPFIQALLDSISEPIVLKDGIKHPLVFTEVKHLTIERDDRLDMLISIGNQLTIAIEVKITANLEDNALDFYEEIAKQFHVENGKIVHVVFAPINNTCFNSKKFTDHPNWKKLTFTDYLDKIVVNENQLEPIQLCAVKAIKEVLKNA
jgi:hypothetical protein